MDSSTDKLNPGSPSAPQPFGKYMLMGLIARGGMAEVYRARSRAGGANRLFAIKCMRPQLAKETKFVDMFVREGSLAVMLEQESIVRTFEIGRTDGRYYIAMEYIGGKDLTQILRRCQETQRRIPVPHACYIAARMAEGLHHAHTLNDADGRPLAIVNRDVSPSNVRIGYDGAVKLLDFGIAQAMVKFTSEIGVLKGKFSYMSPEQIRGMPVDARTDVFSTGIVLHEMLTTEKLFRGDTEFQLMERVRNAEVLPPSKFNRRVREEVDRVVLKALARDVGDRYQSAADLARDLRRIVVDYAFNVEELAKDIRDMFPSDYDREMQELAACLRAPLAGSDEREASLIVNAASLSADNPIIIMAEMSSGAVYPVNNQEVTAPTPSPEEPRPISNPAAPQVRNSEPPADPIEQTRPSNPNKSGLWARIRGRFSKEPTK